MSSGKETTTAIETRGRGEPPTQPQNAQTNNPYNENICKKKTVSSNSLHSHFKRTETTLAAKTYVKRKSLQSPL